MRGYLGGYFSETFKPKNRKNHLKKSSTEVKVEILDQPSTTSIEIIQDNQVILREKLLKILSELNMDKAFINSEFKEKLESHNHQLEVLADWSKPEKVKIKYL